MVFDKGFVMEVLELKQETLSLYDLKLIPVLEHHFSFQPGQYAYLSTPSGKKGCFAIASEPEEKNFIQFLIKNQNEGVSHELCRLKGNDQLRVSVPFGAAYPIERMKGKNVLLIGIGSALAPLRSLIKSMMRKNQFFGKIVFLYGARKTQDIPYQNDFRLWSEKFDVRLAVSQLDRPFPKAVEGRVTDLVSNLLIESDFVACVCGTRIMEEEVVKLLETKGISKQNIFFNY